MSSLSTATRISTRRRFGVSWDPVLVGVGVMVILGLVLTILMVGVLVAASLNQGTFLEKWAPSLANFLAVIRNKRFLNVLFNTLRLATGSVGVTLCWAIPLAWLYTRTDLPGKKLMITLMTLRMAVPGFLVAMGYIFLLNPSNGIANLIVKNVFGLERPLFNIYSINWMIFFQGTALVSAAFFMIVPTFGAIDAALEEAAFVSGVSKWTTLRRVVLPLAGPVIFAAAIYYFIIATEMFDYAGIIGLPFRFVVFSTWIFQMVNPPYDMPQYGQAAALGLFGVAGISLLTILYLRLIRRAERYAVVTGKRGQQRATRLTPRGKLLGWVFIGAFASIDLVIPVLMLVWTSLVPYQQVPSFEAMKLLSLSSYRAIWPELPPLLVRTGTLMLAVPTLAVVISTCTAWVITRTRLPGRTAIEFALMAALAVPAIVGALSFLYLGLSIYKVIPIYTTIWLMVLAITAREITWGNRTISGAMLQLHRELEEACSVSGIPRGRTFISVILPIVSPALLFSWFWLALLTVRNLTIPIMLKRPNTEVLSTAIYGFNAAGKSSYASALGVVLLILIGIVVTVFQFVVRRRHV
jgi:iron(III) transport system permease protein